MRILLMTPPMTQLNTPYPATAYLTGFLRRRGFDVRQADPALELVLRLLSREGLNQIASTLSQDPNTDSKSVRHFLHHQKKYIAVIDSSIRFLQGKDPSLALRICSREFLPEGPRFKQLEEIDWAFGTLGVQDKAKFLASLMIDDLADVIREGIDPRFELSRYGEKLAASAPSFDPLQQALENPNPTLVDQLIDQIALEFFEQHQPELIGLTVPFPGNVYGAFRIARAIRARHPQVKTVLGGGFVNTELRELNEPRVFESFDFITLDDGERPFLCILDHLSGKADQSQLLRTFVRERSEVKLISNPLFHDLPHAETGPPTYDGLPLDRYLSIFELLNPMHRIWSDGRWNKLTLAHGCYWKKCNFCDISLDYIGRYDAAQADRLVDWMETAIRETGQSGFHFVDEAAPPAVLKQLAQRLIDRGVTATWWGNIRFEKTFTLELTTLLAQSGCVAVSGGLEVASDRLLQLMNKGVTVEQVARVTHAFTQAGIMVHAYLMYGFPTQTVQETVDALERVRQLFANGCIQSAYWHRFSATAHSPIGQNPEKFGIQLVPQPPSTFAKNDLPFEDPTPCDQDTLGIGLKRALYNYMHGAGLDWDVRKWFPEMKVPRTTVSPDLISHSIGLR